MCLWEAELGEVPTAVLMSTHAHWCLEPPVCVESHGEGKQVPQAYSRGQWDEARWMGGAHRNRSWPSI